MSSIYAGQNPNNTRRLVIYVNWSDYPHPHPPNKNQKNKNENNKQTNKQKRFSNLGKKWNN